MKQKNLAMLGVAVGCGLVAAVAVAKLSAGGSKGPETVKVLVAKKDIPLQTKLEEKNLENLLTWADVPRNLAPPDAVTDWEQVKDKELNRTLKQGNPVSLGDLGRTNRIELPEGFKAITVKATQVDAAGGFAKPGSKVDVMYVERTTSGKTRAAIILKDMLVLAVNMVHTLDEKTGAAIPQVESVSLAVTDKQATLVALADEKGKLKLVLRGQSKADVEKVADDGEIEWVEDPFIDRRAPTPLGPGSPSAPKMERVVMAKKFVPMNTLINANNVSQFFTTADVRVAPYGVLTNPDDLKGLYIVKDLDEGQWLYKSLTDAKAVEVSKTGEPKATPKVPPGRRLPRFEQVIVESGRTVRVVWMETAPGVWKRFNTEREANEYELKSEPPKAEAPKTGSDK